jgi:hypothetical protein
MMTDLKFTSPSGETTIKFEETGRLGTVAPKTQLHITEMNEKVALVLTIDELKLIDKYIELNDETQSVFDKIKDAYPKPKTLTDLIYDWWEDVFTTHNDWDMETSIENLVDEISLWLPTEHETNSYKWNECIRMIREKLR